MAETAELTRHSYSDTLHRIALGEASLVPCLGSSSLVSFGGTTEDSVSGHGTRLLIPAAFKVTLLTGGEWVSSPLPISHLSCKVWS